MSQHNPLAEKIVSTIQLDLHSGATELARDALDHLAHYVGSLSTVSPIECNASQVSLGEQLRHLRPNMAPMQNILSDWQTRLGALQTSNTKKLSTQVRAFCAQLINEIHARLDTLEGFILCKSRPASEGKKLATELASADTSKYSRLARDDLTLEELPIIELAVLDSPSIHPRNIYFDVTDNDLIGTYITEHGIQKRWPR